MLWIILYYGAWKPEDNFTTYARNLSTTIYQQYFNSKITPSLSTGTISYFICYILEENEDNNGGVMTAARLSIFSWMFLVLSFFWFLNSSHLCWGMYNIVLRIIQLILCRVQNICCSLFMVSFLF